MQNLIERLRGWLSGEKGIRTAVILGLAGMLLILLPSLLPARDRSDPVLPAESDDLTDSYRAALETRLLTLLSEMDGVGQVSVMITVRGSAEQIFAEEVKTVQGGSSTQVQSAYVLTRSGGDESALVAETVYPEIQGVAVLCSSGDHAAVQERIRNAAATVLGIPPTRIFVGKAAA